MTIRSEEINLNTFLDEYAAELFISRKVSEDISSFNERLLVGYENLYQSGPEAFIRSLDYITTERTKEICNITFNEEVDLRNVSIDVNEERIYFDVDGEEYIFNFKEYKFVSTLIKSIKETVSNVVVEELPELEKVSLEKSSNILKTKSNKQFLGFESSERIIKLPVENVISVISQRDMETLLPFNDIEATEILNENEDNLKMIIEYKGFPVKLKWSIFNITACNSDYFRSLLKNENGFLTSEGAKLINEILKKQNTYWGK